MENIQAFIIFSLIGCCFSFRLSLFSQDTTTTTPGPPIRVMFTNKTMDEIPLIESEGFFERTKRGKTIPIQDVKRGDHKNHSESHLKMLMQLLEAGKLQDCAGRVVCDLNCDSSRFGSSGKKVLDMMTKVQNSGSVPVKSIQFLVTAGLSGKMYWWTSTCGRCKAGYPDCFAESDELIDVASIFDIDF